MLSIYRKLVQLIPLSVENSWTIKFEDIKTKNLFS